MVCALGCSGKADSRDGDVLAEAPQFPRLTHLQWENSVRDLLYLADDLDVSSAFLPDPPLGRFDNNIARLQITSGLWSDYQRAAESIGERAAGEAAIIDAIAPDRDAANFIASFGRRAFRRPLNDTERDRYDAMFTAGAAHFAELGTFQAGLRMVVESMLQSPHFLYRTELTGIEQAGIHTLTEFEVASRLSYAFLNTMPTDELLDLAESGGLSSGEEVRAAATALLDDPRAQAQFAHFHFQAFEMREYLDLDKDAGLFPEWDRANGASLRTGAEMFLGSVLFEGGTLTDILTSRRAFVDAELARLYGIEGEFTDEFVEVELDPSQRSGFLTRAGFLAKNATLTEPDPIHRGVFVNLSLLCRDLPAVPDLPDDLMPVGDTNRQRVESLTGDGTCGAGCHSRLINPIGFALENYDALGQWRDQDNGFPVDAADIYIFEDGTEISFNNAVELSDQLAASPAVHSCYIRQVLEYLHGRDLAEADEGTIAELARASQEDGLALREVLIEAVSGNAFRLRATKEEGL